MFEGRMRGDTIILRIQPRGISEKYPLVSKRRFILERMKDGNKRFVTSNFRYIWEVLQKKRKKGQSWKQCHVYYFKNGKYKKRYWTNGCANPLTNKSKYQKTCISFSCNKPSLETFKRTTCVRVNCNVTIISHRQFISLREHSTSADLLRLIYMTATRVTFITIIEYLIGTERNYAKMII